MFVYITAASQIDTPQQFAAIQISVLVCSRVANSYMHTDTSTLTYSAVLLHNIVAIIVLIDNPSHVFQVHVHSVKISIYTRGISDY